jgi:hypothetical protein
MKRTIDRILPALVLGLLLPLSCGDDDDGSGNPSGVGNSCETDEDCETEDCYLGPGGGYCTSPCTDEGDTSECPPDTVCKPIQGGQASCLLICGSDSACDGMDECPQEWCPEGSSCVSVSDTEHLACEPEPV